MILSSQTKRGDNSEKARPLSTMTNILRKQTVKSSLGGLSPRQTRKMPFLFFRRFCFFSLLLCAFPAKAIYNLKTGREGLPPQTQSRHWLLTAEGCHSCDALLSALKSFCSGGKPPTSKIGFWITGRTRDGMRKKMKDFSSFMVFSGSPSEFYESYGIIGSPSLRTKEGKSIAGKEPIIHFLKKDSSFCAA